MADKTNDDLLNDLYLLGVKHLKRELLYRLEILEDIGANAVLTKTDIEFVAEKLIEKVFDKPKEKI